MIRVTTPLLAAAGLLLISSSCTPARSSGKSKSDSSSATAVTVPPADTPTSSDSPPLRNPDTRNSPGVGEARVLEATCDKTYTRTMTYPDSWTKSHTHYAELPIDDLSLSELPHITAVRCDVSRSFGECPDDAQCEDSGAPSMDASVSKDCVETWYTVASGRIRVGCGNSSENQGGNNDWFDRADRVLVRLF